MTFPMSIGRRCRDHRRWARRRKERTSPSFLEARARGPELIHQSRSGNGLKCTIRVHLPMLASVVSKPRFSNTDRCAMLIELERGSVRFFGAPVGFCGGWLQLQWLPSRISGC